MSYSCGDHVVHRNFGVGTIVTMEEVIFPGEQPRLFYRVDFPKSTVWVPVHLQKAGGMRPITHKRDLGQYRDLLKSAPVGLEDNFRKRQIELGSRLEPGTFQSLCEVVRDLSARDGYKSLNNFDLSILKQARAALVSEWAFVSGLSQAEASGEIEAFLAKGRQVWPNK